MNRWRRRRARCPECGTFYVRRFAVLDSRFGPITCEQQSWCVECGELLPRVVAPARAS